MLAHHDPLTHGAMSSGDAYPPFAHTSIVSRIEGPVTLAPEADADAYLKSRPPDARATAAASDQTRPIASRAAFLAKIEEAKSQLLAHDPHSKAKHLGYVKINVNDLVAEYKERHFRQIDEHLSDQPISGVRLIICNDHTLFYKPLQMRFAEVDNVD